MRRTWVFLMTALACALTAQAVAAAVPNPVHEKLGARHELRGGGSDSGGGITRNFRVLGHHDLGMTDVNGDVWVHNNFAYVGTWAIPCDGTGVRIVDVADVRNPELIATVPGRDGTDSEDVVVRRVSTPSFSGDLLAVGIQRCDFEDPELDEQEFGFELWNVTDPSDPEKLSEFPVAMGEGGVHELDLFQRGGRVYALLAHPWGEWFHGAGDFFIVDVTNPRMPVQVAEWGAGDAGLSPGPFWGQGDFGSMFAHSARASADGTKAYVSYWDLGVLTFDISDPGNPELLSRTTYEDWEDGDAHSMTPYENKRGRDLILQNDEDLTARTTSEIFFKKGGRGLAPESAGSTPLWLEPGHRIVARVVMAANQGCAVSDYPAGTAGKIAVVYTPFPFFDASGDEPLCLQQEQEAAAEAAGAVAVVHDFVSENTSPQWFDFGEIGIPVLFADHETAQGMVAAGRARLQARKPTWGFLRVYDAQTGEQLAKFDGVRNVRTMPEPPGDWTIHNTEVLGDRAYSSWYSNGIVALDLTPLDKRKPRDPRLVGQFVPPPVGEDLPFTGMWGVYVRSDGVVFGSDLGSGLWIVKPKGRAAP
ncbi:MAG: PA domain-containing protein [Gaiellaceae bacterium]